jgi:pimeloyl-ACP methyl ester carboxylesterase
MTRTISRRQLLHVGGSTLAMLGMSSRSDALAATAMGAQTLPVRSLREDYQEDHFYREDWLGEPWRMPEPVVLIHGNDESSIEWYAWVPRMAQEYRLIRPDLPGLGHSTIPRGFEYSLTNLATFVIQVMDKAGIESAHIIGAKTGGAVAMRLAADHPKRTRTLVVVGGPASPLAIADPSPIPQRDRLGSNVSKEMIAYWNTLFSRAEREGVKGLSRSLSNFDLAKEGVLQRITAPTLVITADRSKMHSVEKARAYQVQIPNSRLVVIRSDAYHIAAADADECVTHTLAFLKQQKAVA